MKDNKNLCQFSVLEEKRLLSAIFDSIGPKIGPKVSSNVIHDFLVLVFYPFQVIAQNIYIGLSKLH